MREPLTSIAKKTEKAFNCEFRFNKKRNQNIIYAKKVFCHVASRKGYPPSVISLFIGIDRTTVLHHNKDTQFLLKQDDELLRKCLAVQGKPIQKKISRAMFDLSIGAIF